MKAEATGIFPYEAKSIVAVKMPRGICVRQVLKYGYTYIRVFRRKPYSVRSGNYV